MSSGSGGPFGHFGSVDQAATSSAGPWPGNGGVPPDIAAAGSAGAALTTSRSDHTHKGVHSVNGLFGDPVIGGIQTVTDAAALAALPSAGFGNGDTLCYVQTIKAMFQLVASTQAAAALVRVAASGKAGFLWVRVLESTAWWSQLTWFVDPTNTTGVASDENSGATSAGVGTGPLLTFAELNRRFRSRFLPGTETNSYTINLLSDAPDTDFLQVHLDPTFRTAGINVTVQATVAVTAVGNIASHVVRNAATNVANKIEVTGFDFTPHIGKLIRLTATPTTTAVIERAPALGFAELGEQSVNGTPGAGFNTDGVTVEIPVGTKMAGYTAVGPGVTMFFNDVLFNATAGVKFTHGGIPGLTSGTFRRCVIRGGNTGFLECPNFIFTACSFVGRSFTYNGVTSATCSSWVSCTAVTLKGGWDIHRWVSCGASASSVVVSDGQFLRTESDWHSFNLPAATPGVLLLRQSIWALAGNYYGAGNNATSIGVSLPIAGRMFYVAGLLPVMDAGNGVYFDGDFAGGPTLGTNLPFAGGVGVGLPLTPGTITAGGLAAAVQSTKLSAAMSI